MIEQRMMQRLFPDVSSDQSDFSRWLDDVESSVKKQQQKVKEEQQEVKEQQQEVCTPHPHIHIHTPT